MRDEYTVSGEGLVTKLFELLEELDTLTSLFSHAWAEFQKLDKMEKHTIAVLKSASPEKSESAKERDAYANEAYLKWFCKWDEAQKKYLNYRAKREALLIRIDATRSALAFNKCMVELVK